MTSPEQAVGELLQRVRASLAVAESCTGGMLGARVTSVSGSSAYFLGGIIAYSNASKVRDLGVDPSILETEGAVSEPVAAQMALGVQRRFNADYALSVTGIAGPGGGSERKPVGLVYVALADPAQCSVNCFQFAGDRAAVREQTVAAALDLLTRTLAENNRSRT